MVRPDYRSRAPRTWRGVFRRHCRQLKLLEVWPLHYGLLVHGNHETRGQCGLLVKTFHHACHTMDGIKLGKQVIIISRKKRETTGHSTTNKSKATHRMMQPVVHPSTHSFVKAKGGGGGEGEGEGAVPSSSSSSSSASHCILKPLGARATSPVALPLPLASALAFPGRTKA